MKTTGLLLLLLTAFWTGCATSPQEVRRKSLETKVDSIILREFSPRVGGNNVQDFINSLGEVTRDYDTAGEGVNILCFPVPDDRENLCRTFRNVSLREALNIMCEWWELGWAIEDSVIKVRPKAGKVQPPSAGDSSSRADASLGTPEK